MSGDCHKCGEHCLECRCSEPAQESKAVMEWISVKDRLPKHGERILCYCKDYYYIKVFENLEDGYMFYEGDFPWASNPIGEIENVTHWMPLPEPPKN